MPSASFSKEPLNNKKTLVLYTGGTIGMLPSPQGYSPSLETVSLFDKALQHESQDRGLSYDIECLSPLIDSASITPEHWWEIADILWEKEKDYESFLILHGTDTLAYTSSMLSFLLHTFKKPVILTGAQRSIADNNSDATDNLQGAFACLDTLTKQKTSSYTQAHTPHFPFVGLYFNGLLLQGNRSTKIHTSSFAAFHSPALDPVCIEGLNPSKETFESLGTNASLLKTSFPPFQKQDIAFLSFYPGLDLDWNCKNLQQRLPSALVIEAYGAGNGPLDTPSFTALLSELSDKKIPVVVLSQCRAGQVQLGVYATGETLKTADPYCGFDLTREATLTKLYWLLCKETSMNAKKVLFEQNLCGELTKAL